MSAYPAAPNGASVNSARFDTATVKASAPNLLALSSGMTTLRRVAGTNGGEWAGACPFCGGTDRFRVQPWSAEGRWLCRKCTDGKWKDVIAFIERRDNVPFKDACRSILGETPPDPAVLAARAAAAARRAEEDLQASIQRAQLALADLQKAQKWLEYHDQMTERARSLWRARGIPDTWQDIWQLGYDPDHTVWVDGAEHHTPSLSIPLFDIGWQCLNIKHRLLTPPKDNDKYRYERGGLGTAPLFIADPDADLNGPLLLVEGEIKAAVAYITADDARLHVAGAPTKRLPAEHLPRLEQADPVYICFDPDAQEQAEDTAQALGRARCKIISLPLKIDDYLLAYVPKGEGKHFMRWLLKQERRA